MKTIEQLLELTSNPYYVMTREEQEALDDFLSQQSAQKKSAKSSSKNSESNILVPVVNKNIVQKETGVLPTADQVATGKALGDMPVSQYTPEIVS